MAEPSVAATVALATFAPTVENKTPPHEKPPAGMVWIPGGEFSMGAQDPPDMNEVGMQAARDSRPIHRVYVDGFWMDKSDVTNEEFARFVQYSGYKTVAERKPRAEDFPGVTRQNSIRDRLGRFFGAKSPSGESAIGVWRGRIP
jgi:formylglycine-generating enzyme required for sulfatase activity